MRISFFVLAAFLLSPSFLFTQPIIIDHTCAKLAPIPASAILQARDSLHIAYGHTSHGSQLTYGMTALAQQNESLKGYKGDIYCWEHYADFEVHDCLDLHDHFRGRDLGHNGDTTWAASTRDYLLNNPAAKDINVVIWSWCGGCSDNTWEGIQTYLDKMDQLEKDFPQVKFVYMTGHADIWSDATLKANNQHIRDYCIANDKILYDFEDIEHYDPDGNYYEYVNDNCDYYDANHNRIGNWAIEWQNSHTEGVDWFDCDAAHTQPLNGNLKAYAAWHLWARLAGWEGPATNIAKEKAPVGFQLQQNFPNPFNPHTRIAYHLQKGGAVLLAVFNAHGDRVKTLVDEYQQAGDYSVNFTAENLAAGLYLYRLQVDGFVAVRKMALIK